MFSTRLYQALINDRNLHPERLSATWERVEEVLTLTVGTGAGEIIKQCKDKVKGPRDYLSPEAGCHIATVIGRLCRPAEINRIADMLMDSEVSTAEAVEVHEEYKIPVSKLEKDIVPVRGDGAWIIDNKGEAFLDMDSNYSATNLGMNNPEIARGIYNQAMQLISMKEDRVHVPRTRFLKNIREMMPEGLHYFYWQNSGGEAVDKALKIAKAYTGHKGVVAMKGGFHGRTHGAVAVTHEPGYRKPFFLDEQDWAHFTEFNDADAVEELFAQDKAKTVIMEIVQGEEAGIRPAEKDFPKKLRKICDKYGGVMIVDEIQSGFGRTAQKKDQWFSCMVYDVVPDIMTIGKSFGGGYPVTAVVTNEEIARAMKPGYDGSTFGGNPMAMVAAMIATRQMREKDVTTNVIERGKQIQDGLKDLAKKHKCMGEIRGLGLMIAFELPSADHVSRFQETMARHNVKTSLSTREWVRFLPLLVMSRADVDHLLSAVDLTLTEICQ